MINFPTLKNNLYDFVYGQGGQAAVWADQNAPQLTKPYISMRIASVDSIGWDYNSTPNKTTLKSTLTGNREFILYLQAYGTNAMGVLENVRTALQKTDVLDTLRAGGIVFVDDFPIQNLSDVQDTQFLERAAMDILFRIASIVTPDNKVIEKMEDVNAKYYKDQTKVLEEEFSINT